MKENKMAWSGYTLKTRVDLATLQTELTWGVRL